MLERAFLIALGIVLIVASLNDVFQSVIVPRAVGRRYRPSYYSSRTLWRLWPEIARRVYARDDDKREDFLAVFAPTNLVATLMLWSLLLLFGYGSIFYALRADMHPELGSFLDAFYFAGTSFFTIGFGDFSGNTAMTRLISIAAGASGFGVISTTTAYLFAIFGAFQAREQFVVTIGARAGSPPSGVGMLAIAARAGTAGNLSPVMLEAQAWCARVLETHLAYPILAYFRSSHDYESWVGTLGTLLDCAVLMMTTVECDAVGEARILYNLGRHATHDLANYFRLEADTNDPHVTPELFDDARQRLADAGLHVTERDAAWEKFAHLRGTYAAHLTALAEFFDVPPLQWVGRKDPLVQSEHIREQLPPKVLERIDKG
jgi:hypothetical protein